MPKDTMELTLTPRLNLVLNHLSAVRELDAYIHDGALLTDTRHLRNELRQVLNRTLHIPNGWEELVQRGDSLRSWPRKKWGVVRDDHVLLNIYLASPVGADDDPFVELYVPPKWKKRQAFMSKLKKPQGFEHVNDDVDGGWAEWSSIWKYLEYDVFVLPDGTFDSARFMKAILDTAARIVEMETEIDQILENLR